MDDDYLYFKFRKIDKHLIESLVSRELYFAKPDTLNDPFDCRLDLEKSFTHAASSATDAQATKLKEALSSPKLLKQWETQFSSVGICSFSLCSDETLLWSHYADQHKGVCLLYRFSQLFLIDSKNRILGVSKVAYENDRLTEWLKSASLDQNDPDNFRNELTKIYLTAKSPAWKYEKEARIIRFDPGPFPVPHGCLEQICFGLETPRTDVDLVTKLAMSYHKGIKFCRMIRNESDFGIRMHVM